MRQLGRHRPHWTALWTMAVAPGGDAAGRCDADGSGIASASRRWPDPVGGGQRRAGSADVAHPGLVGPEGRGDPALPPVIWSTGTTSARPPHAGSRRRCDPLLRPARRRPGRLGTGRTGPLRKRDLAGATDRHLRASGFLHVEGAVYDVTFASGYGMSTFLDFYLPRAARSWHAPTCRGRAQNSPLPACAASRPRPPSRRRADCGRPRQTWTDGLTTVGPEAVAVRSETVPGRTATLGGTEAVIHPPAWRPGRCRPRRCCPHRSR